MEVLDSWKLEAYLNAAWVDISSYVTGSITNRWGMSSNDTEDRTAKTGKMTFSLLNKDKKFTPGSATMLTGWKVGAWLKLTLTYKTAPYVKFYGFIDSLSIDPGIYGERQVKITALRWMDYAAQYPLKSLAIQQDVTADTALDGIVTAMPIQPLDTDYDTGNSTFPIVFDNATTRTIAYTEFVKLANSEPGYIYEKADGTLVFENSTARGADRVLKQANSVDVEINNTMTSVNVTYGDKIVNRFTATAKPKVIDDTVKKIYELESPLYLAAGQTKTFEIQYTDPTSKRLISALTPPVQGGTKSLLHMDGVPYSEFIDEMGHTWTPVGVSKYQDDKKYGTGCGYFDGSGAWMYTADKDDWDLGSSDFWIAMWVKILDETSGRTIMARDYNISYSPFLFGYSDGANLDVYITSNGSSWDIANAKTFGAIDYDWQYLSLGRSGSDFFTFLNGTLVDTWTSSAAINSSTQVLSLGRYQSNYAAALIDELQFIKGACLYTDTFTPPAAALEAEGQYWAAWTNADKTGTELTGQFTVTGDFGGAGAVMTVTNTSASNGYLTTLKIFAYGVHNDSPITYFTEDSASYEAYGFQNDNLDMPYQSDIDAGMTEAQRVVQEEKQPRLSLNKVTMNANGSEQMMYNFLETDIGDLVYVKEDQTEFEGNVYIHGVDFSIHDKHTIDFSWITKQDFSANISQFDLSLIGCEFDDVGQEDAIDFGYVSAVSTIHNRAFSFWIYLYAEDFDHGYIFSNMSTTTGVGAWVGSRTMPQGDVTLRFEGSGFGGNVGNWDITPNLSISGWVHVLIHYDNSATGNDPEAWIDASSASISENSSPSGAVIPETNVNLVIGNTRANYDVTTDYSWILGGMIKDFRVYDMDVCEDTAGDLATALQAAGKEAAGNTSGLVFQAFGVPTASAESYEDLTLTTQVLYDTIGRNMGTPHGTPITRTTIPGYTELLSIDDTTLLSGNASTNNSTTNPLYIGNTSGGTGTGRVIIIPDWSSLPTGAIATSATLTLTIVGIVEAAARTMSVHRVIPATVIGETTWNISSTGNNWNTAGCSDSTNDYDGTTVLGSAAVSGTPSLYDTIEIELDIDEIKKFIDGTYDNYGMVLFVDTQSGDQLTYGSEENTTAAYRPVLSIGYLL